VLSSRDASAVLIDYGNRIVACRGTQNEAVSMIALAREVRWRRIKAFGTQGFISNVRSAAEIDSICLSDDPAPETGKGLATPVFKP